MVVYLGVVPTALAFTTWAYALTRTTAGRMGATTYVVPAIVVLMSWAFLGETPRPLAYLGGALCLAGVAVSRGQARQTGVAPEPVTVRAAARIQSARLFVGDRANVPHSFVGGGANDHIPSRRGPPPRSITAHAAVPARARNMAVSVNGRQARLAAGVHGHPQQCSG